MTKYLSFAKPQTFFFKEAIFITTFCLLIATIASRLSFSISIILTLFTMAVMSNAAIFPLQGKSILRIFISSLLVNMAITAGGYCGESHFILGETLAVIFVGLAFYLPKKQDDSMLFITSTMMFVLFLFAPSSSQQNSIYFISSILIALLLIFFYWIFTNLYRSKSVTVNNMSVVEYRKTRSIIATSSILAGLISIHFLPIYLSIHHVSWLALTIMMVIQGNYAKTFTTSLKRTAVNIIGAFIGVLLFMHLTPTQFWPSFIVLVLLLFGIFCLGACYFWRVLLIELFVFGLAYIVGSFELVTPIERIVLTSIGSGIVIVITSLIYLFSYCVLHDT